MPDTTGTPRSTVFDEVDKRIQALLTWGTPVPIANYKAPITTRQYGVLISRELALQEVDSYVTPLERFMVRSHFRYPEPADASRWTLSLSGSFKSPVTLSMADLLRYKHHEVGVHMECTGNSHSATKDIREHLTFEKLLRLADPTQWKSVIAFLKGGNRNGMLSNGVFTGIRLFDLLDDHPLADDALEIVFEGKDTGYDNLRHRLNRQKVPYARSFPQEELREYDPLLCFRMNGNDLLPHHGFPLRLVIPAVYGAEHVKWLHRIIASPESYKGYFMENYYANVVEGEEDGQPVKRLEPVHRMKPKSIIVAARRMDGVACIYGTAWRGLSPLESVAVSRDGGQQWEPAEIVEPDHDHSWAFWRFVLDPAPKTPLEIMSRARCQDGEEQPMSQPEHLFYGNNAVIKATVSF